MVSITRRRRAGTSRRGGRAGARRWVGTSIRGGRAGARGWFGQRLALLVLVSLMLTGLAQPVIGQVPLPSPFGDTVQAPRPVIVGQGVDELLGMEDQAEATWVGTYGTGPYGLSSHLGLTDLDHQVQGQWAGYLWSLVVWIARVLLALMSWAFTVDLFVPLAGAIDGIVGALSSSIWQPLIIPTIIVVGLWGAWRGIVRRQISALAEGWVWMLAAIAAGIFFFTQPSTIATAVNTFAAKLSNSALSAVAAVDPGLCEQGDGKCVTGTAQLAQVTDRLWYLYVIKPFVVMEFGDGDLEETYLRRLLDAKTITREDLTAVGDGRAAPEALIESKAEQYQALAEELRSDGDAFEWFSGRRNYERGMIAGMALVAVLIGGLVLGAIAAGVLLAQLGLLLAFLLAPVFLALGIHPGFGRRIATRWGQLSVGMVIKRIGLSILLAVLLVVSGSIMAAADSAGGWYAAVILHVLFGIAALLYRKPFLDLLALATPRAAPLPTLDLRDRSTALRNALGLSFAYAIGRNAVMGKGISLVTSRVLTAPKPPPSGGAGPPGALGPGGPGGRGGWFGPGGRGGPSGAGGAGGPSGPAGPGGAGGAGGPSGSGGPGGSGGSGGGSSSSGNGNGRNLRVGPGSGPGAGNGAGSAFGGSTPAPAGGSRAAAAAAAAAATGALAGAGPAGSARRPPASGQAAQGPGPRRDLHMPYQRDAQHRIVEPPLRHRRPTAAERLQEERARQLRQPREQE